MHALSTQSAISANVLSYCCNDIDMQRSGSGIRHQPQSLIARAALHQAGWTRAVQRTLQSRLTVPWQRHHHPLGRLRWGASQRKLDPAGATGQYAASLHGS